MKKYIASLSLFTALYASSPIYAGKDLMELEKDIEGLRSSISQKRETQRGVAFVGELKKLSRDFESLDADEDVWKALIAKYNQSAIQEKKENPTTRTRQIEIWLDQTPKQAVGSSLFYPEGIEELRDSSHTEHLLQRKDIIWSFAIASRYNDPRGYYYISRILGTLWKDYNDPNDRKKWLFPSFFKELAEKAVKGFKYSADKDANEANPEALSILANEYVSLSGDFIRGCDVSESIGYFEKLENCPKASLAQIGRSKTQLLNFRKAYNIKYTKKPAPTFVEYKEVAKTYSYGKALTDGVRFANDVTLLEEVIQNKIEAANKYGYSSSYIDVGICIQDEDNEKAEEYFEAAGDKGMPRGYIEAGLQYLGRDIIYLDSNSLASHLTQVDEENVEEAITWFQKAADKGDFKGYDYIATLSYAMSVLDKENLNNKYSKKFKEAVDKGLNLGSPTAYVWVKKTYKPEEIKEVFTKYGSPPQGDLWQTIKAFIESK